MANGIKYSGGSPSQVMRELVDAAQEGLEAAAGEWHEQDLPRHFDAGAVSRYGYAPRGKRYQILKARKYHHQQPLVFSGDSMRSAQSRFKVGSRRRGGVFTGYVSMPDLPSYFYKSRRRGDPDKVAELTAVTSDEERQLADAVVRHVDQKMAK